MALGVDSPKPDRGDNDTDVSDGQGELRGSRLIGRVLSPAIKLWLRSQVEQVTNLAVTIEGSDRQLLHGTIPKVSLTARGAIYQGLHLTEAMLTATSIGINFGQVLKGKPLRLLEPVPVFGEVRLTQPDLNASLQAPLLANALSEFLLPLLPIVSDRQQPLHFQNPQITIDTNHLTLSAVILCSNGTQIPFVLDTGLRLASSHELLFEQPDVQISQKITTQKLESFTLDLGSEVDLEELTLIPGKIICRGKIQVNP